jgi:hypothetical protein
MNFDWLNETPVADWTQFGNLLRQTFPLAQFKKKSAIVDDPGDSWKTTFDRWGSAQPRRYRHFSPPPVDRTATIMIVQNMK